MFADSLSLIAQCGLSHLHVFPYSPRPGTPAARMKQVPAPERRARARILRQAGAAAMEDLLDKWLGSTARVLVERDRRGYTEHYLPVRLNFAAAAGDIVEVRLAGRDADGFNGEPVA